MFVGREEELSKLRRLATSASNIVVIFGRRRIGKSALIKEAFKDQVSFCFEGLENQPTHEQLKHFVWQLQEYSGSAPQSASNWREALIQLNPLITKQKEKEVVIVLDEFQWMANYRTEIVSDLKFIWDKYWSKSNYKVTLVLCGSIASFMIRGVIKSKALYGRADTVIHLKPLKLYEIKLMLPHLGVDELFLATLLFGGIPKYLSLLQQEPSIVLAIQKLAFTADSYFQHEFERIFVSHFGRKKQYEQIVQLLAHHRYGLTRTEILALTRSSAGGRVSEKLSNLESAGFITSYPPFDRAPNSRYAKYALSDPYLKFYYAFIKPNLVKSSEQPDAFKRIFQSQAFASWLGLAFEHWCLDQRKLLASYLGFAGIDYRAGPYWGKSQDKNFQIDLLFDRSDSVLTVCEAKYRSTLEVSKLTSEVEAKVAAITPEIGSRTLQKVLITKSVPTAALDNYFFKTVTCAQLIDYAVALKL